MRRGYRVRKQHFGEVCLRFIFQLHPLLPFLFQRGQQSDCGVRVCNHLFQRIRRYVSPVLADGGDNSRCDPAFKGFRCGKLAGQYQWEYRPDSLIMVIV